MRVQTPQVFRARPLLEAYRASVAAGFEGVDTAETIERFSTLEVAVVPGDDRNIKITFVEDLFRAEELAANWDDGRWVLGRRKSEDARRQTPDVRSRKLSLGLVEVLADWRACLGR